jgi:hypothetical protein
MYQDFLKLTQDSLKPVMQLAENNTALAVSLMKSQSEKTVELLESNLAHLNALAETKDVNKAMQLQQQYVETLGEKLINVSKENAAAVEAAMSEAGKLFEGSLAEVQAQAKKTVEKLEKEIGKVAKKSAS